MNVRVKNVNGSSKVSPNPPLGYTSWIEYWMNNTNLFVDKSIKCQRCKKLTSVKDLEGGHVQKVLSSDKKWYIVPLCKSCNHREGIFEIDEDFLVNVPSNF